MPGFVSPIPFTETCKLVDFYPLKQFAPVTHGNHQARAASQWAKPFGERGRLFFRIWSFAEYGIGW